MTELITADLHLSENSRDDYRHRFMEGLPALARKYKADTCLVLGDLTEEKDRHGAWLVNRVVDYIYELAQICRVIILRGNHDYLDAENPFYGFLSRVENVVWVNNPTGGQKLITDPPSARERTLFLPHTSNFKRDWEGLRFKDYDWIFAHNTIEGANVGFGRELGGIPLDVFPNGVRVVAGDIHVPQDLTPDITYVGAPYTIDFGDDYKARVLIRDGKKLRSIPCDGPQKRLIEIPSPSKFVNTNANAGDIVKIRVYLTAEQYQDWHTQRERVRAWAEREQYVVHDIRPVIDRAIVARKKIDRTTPRSDEVLLKRYAKNNKIDDGTLKTGLWLMEKA